MDILFIHKGLQDYVLFALKQAASHKSNKVSFISDTNPFLDGVYFYPINNYPQSENKFMAAYRHMSFNGIDFELFCFKRWFIARDFMKSNNLKKAFVLDTDVLFYPDSTNCERFFATTDVSYFISKDDSKFQWSAGPGTSYWTYDAIDSFCEFLISNYINPALLERLKEKWEFHKQNNEPGGICDMTLFYLFYKDKHQSIKFYDQNNPDSNEIYDCIFSTSKNSTRDMLNRNTDGKINLKRGNGYYHCMNIETQNTQLLNSLHFHGISKRFMHRYYTGKGLFLKKLKSELSLFKLLLQNR